MATFKHISSKNADYGAAEQYLTFEHDEFMAENKQNTTPERRPDCVTEIRMGNTVLVVSGFFKKDTTDTAADKMMKVLEAEPAAGHKAQLSP